MLTPIDLRGDFIYRNDQFRKFWKLPNIHAEGDMWTLTYFEVHTH